MTDTTYECWDIFISFATEDKKRAERLVCLLRNKHHLKVFFSPDSIEPSAYWPESISTALKNSKLVAVLVTNNTKDAYFQRVEILDAIDLMRRNKVKVVPVYLDANPAEASKSLGVLNIIQSINAWTMSLVDVAKALSECRSEIKLREDSKSRRRRRMIIAVAVLAIVLAIALMVIWLLRPKKMVAVLGFRNTSGRPEMAWISTAVSEVLITELKMRGDLGVLDSQVALPEQLNQEDDSRGQVFQELRQQLAAAYVVWGFYDVDGDGDALAIDLEVHLQSPSGREILEKPLMVTARGFFDLVNTTGNRVRVKLGAESLDEATEAQVEASIVPNLNAMQHYAEGINKLRQADALGARESLEMAIASEPYHPLLQVSLAEAWALLGHYNKADEAAKKAVALSSGLPEWMIKAIEGRSLSFSYEWDMATNIYRGLFNEYPRDFEYGLRLMEALTEAGSASSALKIVERLRSFPYPVAYDIRMDLAEADARYTLSDHEGMEILARSAFIKSEATGAHLWMAQALIKQATALQEQDKYTDALRAAETARELFEKAGSIQGLAKAQELLALDFHKKREPAKAGELLEEALMIYKQIGDKKSEARVLNLQAYLEFDRSLPRAEELHYGALIILREIGDRRELANTHNNIGAIRHLTSDLKEALRHYEDARNQYADLEDETGLAHALTNIGEVQYLKGKLDRAAKLHEQARAIFHEKSKPWGEAHSAFRLGEVLSAWGKLSEASDCFRQALTLQEKDGSAADPETQIAFAELLLLQGKHKAAKTRIEEMLRRLSEYDDELAAMANTVLARIFLDEENTTDAKLASDSAQQIATRSNDFRLRFDSAIVAALVLAKSDGRKASEARRKLVEVAEGAVASTFVMHAIEACDTIAEIELDPTESKTALVPERKVCDEARQRAAGPPTWRFTSWCSW